MNNNDLAALAALGAMGALYKNYLDKQGAGQGTPAAGKYPPAEDYVNSGGVGTGGAGGIRAGDVVYGRDNGVGTAGVDKRSDMDDFAVGTGIQARGGNEQRYRDNRGSGKGNARVLGGRFNGSPFANNNVADSSTGERFAPYPEVGTGGAGGMGAVTPEEEYDSGRRKLNAGLAALGLTVPVAVGGGAAAYYAKVKREARLADEARAKMKAEARAGILKDQALERVTEDRDARARAQNEADRAARAQAQAEAEAKSRATQAEIDAELKKYKQKAANVKNDSIPVRAGVSKEAFAAGPTVTSASTTAPTENAARMTAAKKAAAKQAADMEAFNSMLREQKVGPAVEEGKRVKARGVAGKVGLGLTALGLGSAANAATNMTAGERERLGSDVVEGLITPLGLTPSMAGEGSDLYPSKPLSYAEKKKMIEAMSPADRKKYEEAVARQNPGLLDKIKRPSAANQRAGGGRIKAKKMASGGMTSTVSSASKRGDGIASKGKTRCKMY